MCCWNGYLAAATQHGTGMTYRRPVGGGVFGFMRHYVFTTAVELMAAVQHKQQL